MTDRTDPLAPLAGLTVLSSAENYPGPFATLILADLGADVVLVERPPGGDPARSYPVFHESINRNKRSVLLDLKADGGAATFLRLAARADVVIDGFRPGVADRLGIGAEQVRAVGPGVVYAAVTGFGRFGPHAQEPGHDVSLQAATGLLQDRIGRPDPGPPPAVGLADISAAMYTVIGVLAALLRRGRTATGATLDVAMADGLLSWMTPAVFAAANALGPPELPPHEPGYGLYGTADGEILSISITHEDHFWARLCRALDLSDLVGLTGPERSARYDELVARLRTAVLEHPGAQLESLLRSADVPVALIRAAAALPDDDQVAGRGLLVDVPGTAQHPGRRHVRQPVLFDGAAPAIIRHVPAPGGHTTEVLAENGFTAVEIADLLRRGVVLQDLST
jgi:crotonobetainyl-CoA:carnitine CoA-transferase CaiB-like acyl-CoA transferase